MKAVLDLKSFDNRLMDGLKFCRKVYEYFEQIRNSPDGTNKLRLCGKSEKCLLEELIPVARYIQMRCCAGYFPKRQHVEVTLAVHKGEHLLRRLLSTRGMPLESEGYRKTGQLRKSSRCLVRTTLKRPKTI